MAGRLFDNMVEFGRLLRRAGVPVGSSQIVESVRAAELVGLRRRPDFYWALATTLVTRPEHKSVFDLAFQSFWSRETEQHPVRELVVWRRDDTPAAGDDAERERPIDVRGELPAVEDDGGVDGKPADQRDSASDAELLADKHFDKMSADELAAAKRELEAMEYELDLVRTRRRRRDAHGRFVDWRRSFPRMVRGAGAMMTFSRSSPREETPTLVLLCDISGSMQLYSRLLVHFACAIGARRKRTHAFLFGVRLTNISRHLGTGDVGRAVEAVCATTRDFDGGTRVGESLAEFNRKWSRRLLSRKSIVALVTDGLEGGDLALLTQEIARLHRSCAHLIWLNPLLRFDGFEPKAAGVKALLANVDSVHAVHSMRHLREVAAALRAAAVTSRKPS